MELRLVKLISGEVVIGELMEHTSNDEIKLKKPVELRFEPMLGGLSFLPYMAVYLGKEIEEINIKKEHIIHEFKGESIPVEIEGKYREYISGIITPANSSDINSTPNINGTPSIQDLLKGGE